VITFAIIFFCLIGAGYAKGRMDFLADTGEKGKEWKNKYKLINGKLQPPNNHWWYFGLYEPNYQEKFPFSSTSLVFLTDRWHWWQFAMLKYFYFAVSFSITNNLWYQFLLTFIVFPIIVGVTFELVYKCKRK
jgi:hypothetical protein